MLQHTRWSGAAGPHSHMSPLRGLPNRTLRVLPVPALAMPIRWLPVPGRGGLMSRKDVREQVM